MPEAPAYSPVVAPPLGGDPNLLQLSQWAQREFQRVGQRFTNSDTIQYNVMHVVPEKPREGMTVVADGVDWNPGRGGGPYVYIGGQWVPAAPYAGMVPCFSIHKNGTAQSFSVATETLVTWSTEVYDIGSFFASNAWTPPAGLVTMSGGLFIAGTIAAGTQTAVRIYKNGSLFKQINETGTTNTGFSDFTVEDRANGSDVYDVRVYQTAGSALVIDGGFANTWFMGHWISA